MKTTLFIGALATALLSADVSLTGEETIGDDQEILLEVPQLSAEAQAAIDKLKEYEADYNTRALSSQAERMIAVGDADFERQKEDLRLIADEMREHAQEQMREFLSETNPQKESQ
jgi:transcriptional regulator with AAA-type ATPase domain